MLLTLIFLKEKLNKVIKSPQQKSLTNNSEQSLTTEVMWVCVWGGGQERAGVRGFRLNT